jgi:two-component system, NarL family, nitrate/nitrite response regulator NarL
MSLPVGIIGSAQYPTVVVTDVSTMGCQLLAHTIESRRCRVVGSATSSKKLIAAVCELRPDVAVISSQLQDGVFAGLLALRELRALRAPSRSIMLVDSDQSELVVEAFRNGARGIFCRTGATVELRKCVQCVYKGQIWANNTQLEHILKAVMQVPVPKLARTATIVLSKREEEIARLVASGLSNREVAQRLSLSHHTVKNNLFRVFEKLGISTRIELVLYILSQHKGSEIEKH